MPEYNHITVRRSMKKINMTLEKTSTGFSAYAKSYPIFTTGISMPDLINQAYEAAQLYFEEEKIIISLKQIVFEIDFAQFFQHYKVLNAKFLAEKIDMNPTLLSQYIQGHKKPGPNQTAKILSGIQQIGQELSELNFVEN